MNMTSPFEQNHGKLTLQERTIIFDLMVVIGIG